MQKCFLVSNKSTQVKDYLEHRNIIQVTEEHRSLTELDTAHMGIVDVDKFIYIYYESDDGDLSFRADLNIFRSLLASAFFHVDEGLFVLVNCKNAMIEDFITSACKGSNLVGTKLDVVHHSGTLSLTDVTKYIAGAAVGSQVSSTYKAVYIAEDDSEERERYTNQADGLDTILPVLTDQYAMYKKRVEVEAVSSGRMVSETFIRPQTMRDFSYRPKPTVRQWNTFIISGEMYTLYERGVEYLNDYYSRVGLRCIVVDLCTSNAIRLRLGSARVFTLPEIAVKVKYSEHVGYISARYNQLGYLVEMLDNIEGVGIYIFLCDKGDYSELQSFLHPLCQNLYCNYVTHFTEPALQDYLDAGFQATTLFLSRNAVFENFDVTQYRDSFPTTRVASFSLDRVDTTDFYNCAIGGRDNG